MENNLVVLVMYLMVLPVACGVAFVAKYMFVLLVSLFGGAVAIFAGLLSIYLFVILSVFVCDARKRTNC